MANITFTLGTCDKNGTDYRFDYDNGSYKIIKTVNEEDTVVSVIKESETAYAEWNLIKRPEKARKSQ